MKSQYKFTLPKNTPCLICSHVHSLQRPILYVAHNYDDTWQFLCWHVSHKLSQLKIVTLQQATQIDETINQLFEMPVGVAAKRKTETSSWEPYILPHNY